MLALEAKVPIVPMAVVGSFKPFTTIKYIIDKPIDISKYYPKENERVNPRNMITVTNEVMDKIIELRDSINTEEIEKQMNEAEDKREKKLLEKAKRVKKEGE